MLGFFEENPGLVDEEGLEDVADLWVANDRVGAVEDVEEQRLQNLRIFPHALEIEALETRESDVVLGIVEQESELPALFPLVESVVEITAQGVAKRTQRTESSSSSS